MLNEKYVDGVLGSGGGGGKGGGGSLRTPVEARDSLLSDATVRTLDLIGEGAIGGLIDGAKSIFLNNTPLQKTDGSYNFPHVTWAERTGTPSQSVIPGYANISTPFSHGGIEITHAVPQVFTISDLDVDRVKIIISFPSLFRINRKTGDISGINTQFRFQIAKDGAAFVNHGPVITISGKNRNLAQREFVITLPKPASIGWQVKIVKISNDPINSDANNSILLDSHIEIVDSKINYKNSAVIGLTVGAKAFSSMPTRSYLVSGMRIQVPSNYNPTTRVYTGIWNGSFITGVTSNPAWILYDLLTSKRYGIGNYISPSMIDKAALYSIGRYCDEMVPELDGSGDFEPRFTINTQIQQQSDAYRLIADITSTFRAMAFWGGGIVSFKQDSPSDPVKLFNQTNVIGGNFSYSSTSSKDRHSIVNVTWNDPDQLFKQVVEPVEDRALIDKIGIRSVDTVAYGCTSRSQAHRVGKWILYTEQFESNVVRFRVGLDGSMLLPGDVIKIFDIFKTGERNAGRITSATLSTVTFDAPVMVPFGTSTLILATKDGGFVERTFGIGGAGAGPVAVTTVNLDTPLVELPDENAAFGVETSTTKAALFRVFSVAQDGTTPTEFEVMASAHNPDKYALIEQNRKLPSFEKKIAKPYDVNISSPLIEETAYKLTPGSVGNRLHVSWEGRAETYKVLYKVSPNAEVGGNWKEVQTTNPVVEIDALDKDDIVDVVISGKDTTGNWSEEIIASHTVVGKSINPEPPTDINVVAHLRSATVSWINSDDTDLSYVEIYKSTTNNSATATLVTSSKSTSVVISGLTPLETYYFWLKSVDTAGNKSVFDSQPATTGFEITIPNDSSTVTGLATSSELAALSDVVDLKLDAADYVQHFRGVFVSLSALNTAIPTAAAGDYAQVDPGTGTNLETYAYDLQEGWVQSNAAGSGAANTDGLAEGSSNLYFTASRVRSTVLTGLSLATNQVIAATDTVIAAFGYLQKQISDLLTSKQDNITLTTTGTSGAATFISNVLNIPNYAASGGGGLTDFTEGVSSSSPNATVPAHYLLPVTSSADADISIIPKGVGAFQLAIPNNAATGGSKRGEYAVDLQLQRSSSGQVASSINSGLFAGRNNTALGEYSGVFCGYRNTAQHIYSVILGGRDAYSKIMATQVFGGGGQIDTFGDSQITRILLKGSTTNTTPKILTVDLGSPSASPANEILMEPQSAITVRGTVIAKQQNSTNASAWEIDIFASCGTSGGPVIKQNTVNAKTGNIASQTLAVSSTTNSGSAILRFTFTGTSVNMKILADLQIAEVGYV